MCPHTCNTIGHHRTPSRKPSPGAGRRTERGARAVTGRAQPPQQHYPRIPRATRWGSEPDVWAHTPRAVSGGALMPPWRDVSDISTAPAAVALRVRSAHAGRHASRTHSPGIGSDRVSTSTQGLTAGSWLHDNSDPSLCSLLSHGGGGRSARPRRRPSCQHPSRTQAPDGFP